MCQSPSARAAAAAKPLLPLGLGDGGAEYGKALVPYDLCGERFLGFKRHFARGQEVRRGGDDESRT